MRDPITSVRSLLRDQHGVTGLETAIILIAFVVVASVFAFTVLSTGIFSAERGKETIHAGLKESRSSLGIKGSVVANGVVDKQLSTGESPWTSADGNVTVTATSTDNKEGTFSVNVSILSAFGTGLAAYENATSTIDLSSTDSIQLWIKSSVASSTGALQLVLDDSDNCGSSLEDIDLPALGANTWKLATVAISDNSDMTAIKCVGLKVVTDNGAQTVRLDDIFGRGQATTIVVTVTNALEGEPVDMAEPSDADANGVSDSDSTHTLVLAFTDKNQVISDIYWTKDFVGNDDSDDLLESGEKVAITVTLKGLLKTSPVVKDTEFQIEIRPEDGGVLVIERRTPDSIDAVMNLN